MGSSALRIWMLVYTVFFDLHLPHVKAPSGAEAASTSASRRSWRTASRA